MLLYRSSNSFLRRGNSANSSHRKGNPQSNLNLWCPSPASTPSTPVKSAVRNLTRNKSDYSLPSSPKHLPRCHSDNFSQERLRVPEEEISASASASPRSGRHVTWAGATTTIRATYRFSRNSSPNSSPRFSVPH